MQRLTWTGIALHAGALPGYAASHGCVRLPNDFAEHIYDLTKVGMRVVVAREGIAPVVISEPSIFRRNVAVVRAEGIGSAKPAEDPTGRATSAAALEARVAALGNAADEAAQRTREKRAAATRAKAPVQPAERALRQAEAGLAKAETDLKTAEKVLADGGPGKRLAEAEALKASAPARIEAARAQREKMEADLKGKLDAARDAEQASAAAETAHAKALEAVEQAKQSMAPVSVFVSRKTQRIYVRKALQPLWEGPVLIRDADKPLGTFVFTANEAAEGSRKLRWSVLSLYKNPTLIEPPAPHAKAGKRAAPIELPITDAAAADAALGRLVVPAEIADRISDVVLAGSSLIISDEPPNLETGKDTDFVVIMSGEPQGGIAIRQHAKPERSYAGEGDWGIADGEFGAQAAVAASASGSTEACAAPGAPQKSRPDRPNQLRVDLRLSVGDCDLATQGVELRCSNLAPSADHKTKIAMGSGGNASGARGNGRQNRYRQRARGRGQIDDQHDAGGGART